MSSEERKVILEVQNLQQFFDIGHKRIVKAVNNISFKIYEGEVFGLVGESGSGKSTTGRSIIKLYNITGGNIYFRGKRISVGISSLKKQIEVMKKYIHNTDNEIKLLKELKKLNNIRSKDLSKWQKERIVYIKNESKVFGKSKEEKQLIFEIKTINKKVNLSDTDKLEIARLNEKLKIEKSRGKYYPRPNDIKKIESLKQDILEGKKDNEENFDSLKNIQMIFQDPMASLNPRMKILDIISEGLDIHYKSMTKKQKRDKVIDFLKIVGLSEGHANRYPHEFSGGQRQRVGIARALITNPKLIIADEAISALDVSIQAQVVNLMNDLKHKFGLTYLFIAHDLSMVKYISDRIGVMHKGKLVEVGTSNDIYNNPQHEYTKSLLSAIPFPDPLYEADRIRVVYDATKHDYLNSEFIEISEEHYFLNSKIKEK